MGEVDEEIESIKMIFCHSNEIVMEKNESKNIILRINLQSATPLDDVILTLMLLPTYPLSLPLISIMSPKLSRSRCDSIKSWLMKKCEPFVGAPMLYQIISLAQEYLEDMNVKKEEKCPIGPDLIHTTILRLDHMRDRANYCKAITRWSEELELVGRLYFCRRLILIVLQGTKENIKQYIRLNRSQLVDVDSKGKACKERLLSVLLDDVTTFKKSFDDFQMEELNSFEDLKRSFKQRGLDELYNDLNWSS